MASPIKSHDASCTPAVHCGCGSVDSPKVYESAECSPFSGFAGLPVTSTEVSPDSSGSTQIQGGSAEWPKLSLVGLPEPGPDGSNLDVAVDKMNYNALSYNQLFCPTVRYSVEDAKPTDFLGLKPVASNVVVNCYGTEIVQLPPRLLTDLCNHNEEHLTLVPRPCDSKAKFISMLTINSTKRVANRLLDALVCETFVLQYSADVSKDKGMIWYSTDAPMFDILVDSVPNVKSTMCADVNVKPHPPETVFRLWDEVLEPFDNYPAADTPHKHHTHWDRLNAVGGMNPPPTEMRDLPVVGRVSIVGSRVSIWEVQRMKVYELRCYHRYNANMTPTYNFYMLKRIVYEHIINYIPCISGFVESRYTVCHFDPDHDYEFSNGWGIKTTKPCRFTISYRGLSFGAYPSVDFFLTLQRSLKLCGVPKELKTILSDLKNLGTELLSFITDPVLDLISTLFDNKTESEAGLKNAIKLCGTAGFCQHIGVQLLVTNFLMLFGIKPKELFYTSLKAKTPLILDYGSDEQDECFIHEALRLTGKHFNGMFTKEGKTAEILSTFDVKPMNIWAAYWKNSWPDNVIYTLHSHAFRNAAAKPLKYVNEYLVVRIEEDDPLFKNAGLYKVDLVATQYMVTLPLLDRVVQEPEPEHAVKVVADGNFYAFTPVDIRNQFVIADFEPVIEKNGIMESVVQEAAVKVLEEWKDWKMQQMHADILFARDYDKQIDYYSKSKPSHKLRASLHKFWQSSNNYELMDSNHVYKVITDDKKFLIVTKEKQDKPAELVDTIFETPKPPGFSLIKPRFKFAGTFHGREFGDLSDFDRTLFAHMHIGTHGFIWADCLHPGLITLLENGKKEDEIAPSPMMTNYIVQRVGNHFEVLSLTKFRDNITKMQQQVNQLNLNALELTTQELVQTKAKMVEQLKQMEIYQADLNKLVADNKFFVSKIETLEEVKVGLQRTISDLSARVLEMKEQKPSVPEIPECPLPHCGDSCTCKMEHCREECINNALFKTQAEKQLESLNKLVLQLNDEQQKIVLKHERDAKAYTELLTKNHNDAKEIIRLNKLIQKSDEDTIIVTNATSARIAELEIKYKDAVNKLHKLEQEYAAYKESVKPPTPDDEKIKEYHCSLESLNKAAIQIKELTESLHRTKTAKFNLENKLNELRMQAPSNESETSKLKDQCLDLKVKYTSLQSEHDKVTSELKLCKQNSSADSELSDLKQQFDKLKLLNASLQLDLQKLKSDLKRELSDSECKTQQLVKLQFVNSELKEKIDEMQVENNKARSDLANVGSEYKQENELLSNKYSQCQLQIIELATKLKQAEHALGAWIVRNAGDVKLIERLDLEIKKHDPTFDIITIAKEMCTEQQPSQSHESKPALLGLGKSEVPLVPNVNSEQKLKAEAPIQAPPPKIIPFEQLKQSIDENVAQVVDSKSDSALAAPAVLESKPIIAPLNNVDPSAAQPQAPKFNSENIIEEDKLPKKIVPFTELTKSMADVLKAAYAKPAGSTPKAPPAKGEIKLKTSSDFTPDDQTKVYVHAKCFFSGSQIVTESNGVQVPCICGEKIQTMNVSWNAALELVRITEPNPDFRKHTESLPDILASYATQYVVNNKTITVTKQSYRSKLAMGLFFIHTKSFRENIPDFLTLAQSTGVGFTFDIGNITYVTPGKPTSLRTSIHNYFISKNRHPDFALSTFSTDVNMRGNGTVRWFHTDGYFTDVEVNCPDLITSDNWPVYYDRNWITLVRGDDYMHGYVIKGTVAVQWPNVRKHVNMPSNALKKGAVDSFYSGCRSICTSKGYNVVSGKIVPFPVNENLEYITKDLGAHAKFGAGGHYLKLRGKTPYVDQLVKNNHIELLQATDGLFAYMRNATLSKLKTIKQKTVHEKASNLSVPLVLEDGPMHPNDWAQFKTNRINRRYKLLKPTPNQVQSADFIPVVHEEQLYYLTKSTDLEDPELPMPFKEFVATFERWVPGVVVTSKITGTYAAGKTFKSFVTTEPSKYDKVVGWITESQFVALAAEKGWEKVTQGESKKEEETDLPPTFELTPEEIAKFKKKKPKKARKIELT